jgi:catechol 2,3-dioxygenase-like lactoylglutathione lyase family enzyme
MTRDRTADARSEHATQVLHCNLNVLDVAAAAAVYEHGLGLTVRMRSEEPHGDATAMGIVGPIHSVAWFLYDHRGGHVSPAIELVEWRTPPTSGSAYEDPTAIGMQALRFTVPSVEDATRRLERAGAMVTGRRAASTSRARVDAELLDRDGVRLELVDEPTATAPTFSGVRLSCTDLGAAAAWYGVLGWRPVTDAAEIRWDGDAHGAAVQPLTLAGHPFELHLTEWPSAARRPPAHDRGNARGLFRMALAVDDVRAAYEGCADAVQIAEPEYVPLPGTPLGGLWVSFLRDLDGVTVELVERTTGPRVVQEAAST